MYTISTSPPVLSPTALPVAVVTSLLQAPTVAAVVLTSSVTYDAINLLEIRHDFPNYHGYDESVTVNATSPSPGQYSSASTTTTTTTTTSIGSAEWTTDVTEIMPALSHTTQTMLVSFVLGIIIVVTVTGNFLVVASIVFNAHLRTTTNYFIANLAIADLLLGTTVLPFSASLEVLQYWAFGQIFCNVWAAIDVLCCTASILSLCVISIDRYIGVTRPLQHPSIVGHKRALCVILGVWLLSGIISVAPLIGWKEEPDPNPLVCTVTTHTGYVLFSTALSFYIPCLILLLVYYRIYRKTVAYTKCIAAGGKMAKVDEENKIVLRIHTGNSRSTNTNASTKTTASLQKSYSKSDHDENNGLLYEQVQRSNSNSHSLPLGRGHSNGSGGGQRAVTPNTRKGSNFNRPSDAFQDVGGDGLVNNRSRKKSPGSAGSRVTFSSRVAKFKREKKAAKTLGIVVGVFITCWLPFFFILPLQSICTSCDIPSLMFKLFFWLGYCNSTMNPIIYTCSSTEFRRAFQAILFCRKCRRRHASTVTTTVKLKVKSRKSGKSKPKKESSRTVWNRNNTEFGDTMADAAASSLSTSVSSPCFRHIDNNVDKQKNDRKNVNVRRSQDLDHRTSQLLCDKCTSSCPDVKIHLDSTSNHSQITNSKLSCSRGSNTTDPSLHRNATFLNSNGLHCVCCKTVLHSNDMSNYFRGNGTVRDRLPSSCEISMASLSCHSSSPTMSSS